MKDNEIGEYAECRRKVKTHNIWLDNLKKNLFIHSVDTTQAIWLQNLLHLKKEWNV